MAKLSQLNTRVSLRSYFSVDAEKILIRQRNLSKTVFTFLLNFESDQEIFSPSLRGANPDVITTYIKHCILYTFYHSLKSNPLAHLEIVIALQLPNKGFFITAEYNYIKKKNVG